MVTLVGARVRGIDVTGLGGECRHDGNVTPMGGALIAWGGVMAQLAVLVTVGALLLIFGPPQSIFLAEMADAGIYYNLVLMGLNLLPLPRPRSSENQRGVRSRRIRSSRAGPASRKPCVSAQKSGRSYRLRCKWYGTLVTMMPGRKTSAAFSLSAD